MTLQKIEIQKSFDLEELTQKLRNVKLKGFPDINIYKNSKIEIESYTPETIKQNIFTPQPTIYRPNLNRIDQMTKLFADQGIDIFKLKGGVDYIAHDENGEQTQWTIIPPVVEIIKTKFTNGKIDYTNFIAEALKKELENKGHKLNPELNTLKFKEYEKFLNLNTCAIPIICDGSHRVHAALEKGLEQHILVIEGQKEGYPYYAAPKPYSEVHVEPERPEGGGHDKTHVLTEPGHKLLYRLFPTGGILSGTLRPGKH